MAVDCQPESLLTASQDLCCIPKGMEPEIIIYLLNNISGLNLTPEQLMDNAACYNCIPSGMQSEVQLYLLCQIADAAES